MPYEERVGESKLHVVKDGVRFLRTILDMTLMWQPAKLFVGGAVLCLAVMVLLTMHPAETWLRVGRFGEDMIYRLLFCLLLGTMGMTLLSGGVVCDHLHRLLSDRRQPRTFLWNLLDKLYSFRGFSLVALLCAPALGWLVGHGVWTWVAAGYVDVHWSRVVLAGLVAFGVGQMLVTVLMVNLLRFHTARKSLHEEVQAGTVSAASKTVRAPMPINAAIPTGQEVPAVPRQTPADARR